MLLADPDTEMGIDPTQHIRWARSIARGVRRDYRFLAGSPEEAELESTAYLALVKKSLAFDTSRVPEGGCVHDAFRGYASQYIRKECRREAIRLRNGGTYHTRREKHRTPIVAVSLDSLPPLSVDSTEMLAEPEPGEMDVFPEPPPIRVGHYQSRKLRD